MTFEVPMGSIEDRLDSIERLVQFALTNPKATKKLTLSVKDIAELEGVSVSQLRHDSERYLLPRFGESGYPTGTCRWDVEEYFSWRKIPPEERLRMYREYQMRLARELRRKA